MSIEGRIAIDVNFADSSDTTGVQSLKKIQLADTAAYTSGKAAIVAGTIGTATVQVELAPTTYRDASGGFVSFSSVAVMAGKTSRSTLLTDNADFSFKISSNQAFIHPLPLTPPYVQLVPQFTSGTASYTLVLYGT
jgi:hypothetical protein